MLSSVCGTWSIGLLSIGIGLPFRALLSVLEALESRLGISGWILEARLHLRRGFTGREEFCQELGQSTRGVQQLSPQECPFEWSHPHA